MLMSPDDFITDDEEEEEEGEAGFDRARLLTDMSFFMPKLELFSLFSRERQSEGEECAELAGDARKPLSLLLLLLLLLLR